MEQRISKESARLIESLDSSTRYIKFSRLESAYSAVICSQVTDQELSSVLSGGAQLWLFDDIDKAVRSIRRLNKNIQIYTGVFSSEISSY